MIFSRFETPQNLTPFEPICASVVVILGSRFAPPWFGSTGLCFRTLKCRKQTGNLPKRRSKLAPQRFNQKLMQSVWFFPDSRRPKIWPLLVAERSYSRDFKVKIRSSVVRIWICGSGSADIATKVTFLGTSKRQSYMVFRLKGGSKKGSQKVMTCGHVDTWDS